MGDQRLPAGAGRLLRLRRPPGGHARAPQDGRARGDHLRRRIGVVRPDATRRRRRGLARGVPRAAGPGRGDHVPGRDRHRGADVRPAFTRPGPGAVLRHRRRPDRDRPDRGRLPARVDLAGDLLDQHPRRAHRPSADRHLQAGHRAPPRADGLPRPGPHRRRRRPERVRPPAVGHLGLGQPGHRGVHRRGHRAPRSLLRRRAPDGITPDQRAHLRQPGLHRGERHPRHRHDGVHPGVLLRQHLRADRAGGEGDHGQPAHLVLLPRLRGLRADRRPDAGPDRGQAPGGARLRPGRRRVRAVGREGDRPARRGPGHLHRHGRGRHGADARPGQHRRDQPGLPVLLRRGHRHHPDRPELRRQPRVRHPRHDPDHRFPVQDHLLAHRPGPARTGRLGARLRRLPSCRAGTATSPRSRRSSAPTSPAPPGRCST